MYRQTIKVLSSIKGHKVGDEITRSFGKLLVIGEVRNTSEYHVFGKSVFSTRLNPTLDKDIKRLTETYVVNNILEVFGISLLEFSELPSYVTSAIVDEARKINEIKVKAKEDAAKQAGGAK